ncbi:tRNA-specific 2-thiouridylase [Dehalogenimonas formicexedens]|uniref:tRNA-specific 2-thiouridylase MnmA n=1 Tax=Dehalogenimonas formicexedens TaxID=1839801 RepID=A0A1P8F775_9CHLR|nr:tRNA 2-thiouridine(34) synthase MnmA [Dehalogenimonas formicexedens]APV44327.1 tRNA-specific 2-thiouridylase [Dehalogenimonas formicexedens]
MTRFRVAVAMSGGVDSSVAALRLKEAGYDVSGVTMRLTGLPNSIALADSASIIAAKMGIRHYIFDLTQQFQKDVIDYFCEGYRAGRTPNPCIICNQQIKFGALLKLAETIGATYLATGHYARIQSDETGYHIYKATDPRKDQSYFLYRLSQAQLSRVILPLGELEKDRVRQIAADAAIPVQTNESQDICFLESGDYQSFLESRFPMAPGEIIDTRGEVVGRHRGIARYTIGQRHGLDIVANCPRYVTRIDAVRNQITVGDENALFQHEVRIENIHWISGSWPADVSGLSARIRYRMPDSCVTSIEPDSPDSAVIAFEKPVRAVTPGQSAVIYRCDEVLGGGIITA